MPISNAEHFLGLDMLQCSQRFQHAPSVTLEAESTSDLSEDCGLFVDAQVHEGQFLEFNGSAEACWACADNCDAKALLSHAFVPGLSSMLERLFYGSSPAKGRLDRGSQLIFPFLLV
jgi:hypothetical protein